MDDLRGQFPHSKSFVLECLQGMIHEAGTQANFADLVGVSPAFVCAVLKGEKDISPKMLAVLGFKRVEAFVRLEAVDE